MLHPNSLSSVFVQPQVSIPGRGLFLYKVHELSVNCHPYIQACFCFGWGQLHMKCLPLWFSVVSCFLWLSEWKQCLCAGSTECFHTEMTGCVPAVVAYQGTTAALRTSSRFTYSSLVSTSRNNRLLIGPASIFVFSSIIPVTLNPLNYLPPLKVRPKCLSEFICCVSKIFC